MVDCVLNGFFSEEQRVRYRDVLKRRWSCRSFVGIPEEEVLEQLYETANKVNLPGIRIVIDDCPSGLLMHIPFVEGFTGVRKYAAIIANIKNEHASICAGISGEAFILEAACLGIASCWVSGSFNRGKVRVKLAKDEKVLAIIPFGLPEKPETPIKKRKKINEICLTKPDQWPNWAYQAAEAVRIAPSAMNRQPWRMNYGHHSLRLMHKGKGSLDDGIAMMHMEVSCNTAHLWTWGDGGCVAHLTVEDES